MTDGYGRIGGGAARQCSIREGRTAAELITVLSRWTPRYLTDILKGTASANVCTLTQSRPNQDETDAEPATEPA